MTGGTERFTRLGPSRGVEGQADRRARIAVYGATDAALELLPALARRRDLELVVVYDPNARALRRRLALIEPGAARLLQAALSDDLETFARTPELAIAIDGGLRPDLRERVPALARAPGIECLAPAAAAQRLGLVPSAWREPAAPPGRRAPQRPAAPLSELDRALDAAIGARRPFVLLRCIAVAAAEGSAANADAREDGLQASLLACLREYAAPRDGIATADAGGVLAFWSDSPEAPAERRVAQARAAAEAVAAALRNASPRPSLAFGVALHPEHGADRATLMARASAPRIRVL